MKNNFTKEIAKDNPSPNVVVQFGLLVALMVLMAILNAGAQTVSPMKYWTFNGTNAATDSMGVTNLNFTTYNSQYTVGTNGQVGKYITLASNSSLIDGGPMPLTNSFTIEFLFKPGYNFNTTNMMQRADGSITIRMEYSKLSFNTSHKSGSGASVEDNWEISLDGLGRKSYSYYMDNNWHHMVFRFDGSAGTKQVWVDGQLASGFSKTITPGTFTNSGNYNFFLNHTVNYVKYFGSIDELALYNTAIPAALIYKHYLGIQNGQPYNFVNNYTQAIPAAAAVSGPVDVNEFAIGHPAPSMTATEQINLFPVPRYKPGNTLLKNVNWMDPKYMGGCGQPGISNQQAATNSTIIQSQLANNFNYYFNVEMGNGLFQNEYTTAANANPNFKLSLIIFRAQLNGNSPDLNSQNKPASHYLQNASGQFIDANGNVTSSKIWRPTAPTSSYAADGNNTLSSLNDMFSRLNRNVDVVNENGELFPHPTDVAMAKDPVVTAAKNASGLDWEHFLSKKYQENETQSYRDILMTHPRLSNAKFTEYSIDGFPQYRMKYAEARSVNSQINGQYYATPDFYPRWASNWRNWMAAWHGWQWIVESRVNELAMGDKLYSPFVAAGWDNNEEVNMRPAQWLGLLKCLGMTGAEFYYTGYFSLSSPFPDSKNWIWQSVMPAYAQAVTSRYEDFLRNGSLMDGDVANSYTNPTAPGYSFWAGDLRKLVVVRKHNSINKYAITGTVQPNSNMVGNAEEESIAKIYLDGQYVSFKVRRQGSTYIYDKSNAASPVFYQLDAWHENTHPSRWSKDFNLEGELFDNTNSQVSIKTQVPSGTTAGDFTNYTSYVAWPDNTPNPTPVEYTFTPRSGSNNELYVWVRARARGGVATSMNVQVDNAAAKTIGCISDTAWTWYRYDACTQLPINIQSLTIQNHIFRITPGNDKLEIDRIILTTDVAMLLNSAPPACGATTATVTANGNTSFCQGGNVTLTASTGSSYQWLPGGQTTQSITVSNSGSYYVNVSSGSGCAAISNSVTVTVLQAPSATITAGGSTTLCQGNSVTLTATAGATSYLWTPGGQTTQAITTGTAGNYTVRVTNAGGCSATSNPVLVAVGTTPNSTITPSGSTSFCQGQNVTLSAPAANAYLWFPGGQTTQSILVSAANSYTVRVTGSGGCTAMSAPVAVTVNSAPVANITANGPTTICNGGTVSLTASPGASYLWSPGGQTSQSINVSSAGSYSVRVANASGCSTTSAPTAVVISSNPTATITTGGPTSFCAGGSVNLTASTGTSYLWSPGGQTTQSISVATANSYTVRVTGNGGCTAVSAPVAVTVNSAPLANITAGGPTTLCNGGNVSLTASSGSAYLWSPGGQTTQSINAATSGSYSVRVMNASGCSTTSAPTNVVISSSPAANISTSGPTSFCAGGNVNLTASNGASYLWSPGGQTTQTINATTSGAYSVRVTNAAGCSATSATTNVFTIAAPNAAIAATGPTNFCTGGSVTLLSSGGASYLWSPGGQTTQSISATATGAYSVRVTNSSGCSATSAVTNVSVNASPNAIITPGGSTNLCPGQNVALTASSGSSYLWSNGQTSQTIYASSAGTYSVTVSSGAGCSATSLPQSVTVSASVNAAISANGSTALLPGQNVMLIASGGSSYLWSPGGQTTPTIIVSTAGSYSVTAYNAAGCSATTSPIVVTTIPITGPPASISSNGGTAICPGSTILLTANNGSAYLWSPGGQTSQSIAVSAGGNYSVMVTDISGNGASSANIDITVNPVPDAPAIMTTYIPNSSFQLTAYEPTAHTYLWGNGSTSQTITVNSTGNYTVRAINGMGCMSPSQAMSVTSLSPQPCGNPNMLSNYGITKTEAILSWNPAVTADSFRVNYTRTSTQVTQSVFVRGNVTTVKLKDLAEGESYKWAVFAMCNGNLNGTNSRQFTTLSGPLPCGSTPQYLQTTNINATMAKISWFDTQADKFVVRYKAVGTSIYQYRRSYASLTEAMIMGLTPGTTYEWSVRSMCDANVSLYSAPQFFTTLTACPSIGTVTVTELGFNKARLSWNSSVQVDTVMIRIALSGTTDYKVIKIAGNPGNYFVMGLLPQTTYDAWVATKCSSGSTSIWGAGVTFTTFIEPGSRSTPEAGQLHLNAFPNPTKYHIGFVFDSKSEAPYTVKVCDLMGRVLLAETKIATEGKNGDDVSLAGFTNGLYMLVVEQGPMVGRFKFNISK